MIKFLFDLAAIFLPVAVAKEYPCSHSWWTAARIFDAVEGRGLSRLHLCLFVVMPNSWVVAESWSPVAFFTSSARLADDTALNSSACSHNKETFRSL